MLKIEYMPIGEIHGRQNTTTRIYRHTNQVRVRSFASFMNLGNSPTR